MKKLTAVIGSFCEFISCVLGVKKDCMITRSGWMSLISDIVRSVFMLDLCFKAYL